MANRSYLYSSNVEPVFRSAPPGRKLVGISEWNYAIPIVFRLLLSGNPQVCHSSLWEIEDKIGIIGNFDEGVDALKDFLGQLSDPKAQPLITEALEFLSKPEYQNEYFILECGEIYVMGEGELSEQNLAVVESIRTSLPKETKALVKNLNILEKTEPPSLLKRIFGGSTTKQPVKYPLTPFHELGLGNWSNILYFDFSKDA